MRFSNTEKLKRFAKTALKVVVLAAISSATFAGLEVFREAWGFREDGWVASINALVAFYVLYILWNAPSFGEVVREKNGDV